MNPDKKIYVLHCNNCNYKRFTDGHDLSDLVEVKTSKIPRGIPKLDPLSNKPVTPPELKRQKFFKCPKCGYTVRAFDPDKKLEIKDE
jgi:DNA-directed RNA polymerase subunit RPC12/RpoP